MKSPQYKALKSTSIASFEVLYGKFSSPLYKFIAKRVGAKNTVVEEIFEETIVAGWKGYKTFRHKSSYLTWLCRIALNKIADYYHDQVNQNSRFVVPLIDSLIHIDSQNLSIEEELVLKELRFAVNKCLNLLPYGRRKLLWFRYWKDMSYAQIGRVLGISERAVEGRLYRAKTDFARVWVNYSK